MAARRWTALAGLTVAALVLGYLGFERLPEGDEWSFGDSLHRSLQLFVLESGGRRIKVRHEGPKPDTFRDLSEVVARGRLSGRSRYVIVITPSNVSELEYRWKSACSSEWPKWPCATSV